MTVDDIRKSLGGKLVGRKILKDHVCYAITLLPTDVQEYITKYCWFVGSMDDAWGYAFTGNDLADQHLIFLSDELFAQDEHQIIWSIIHEIGHVVLGHKNNIFIKQTKQQIRNQEKEADQFAAQFV